jgi:hypothetical protein
LYADVCAVWTRPRGQVGSMKGRERESGLSLKDFARSTRKSTAYQ